MTDDANEGLLKIKVQVLLGRAIAIGPGKAALLDAIARTGSIAAAGRELGFSYRRTRDMIETLNASWRVPIVEGIRGGAQGGGATLTEAGRTLLKSYRTLDVAVQSAAQNHADDLMSLLGPWADSNEQ